ncbi:MAG: acyl carrier protein [Ferruginibacter sp.]
MQSNTLEKLNTIFCDILDNDGIILNEGTTADDIEEWDSISHVQLIVAIERFFKIKFNASEIRTWKNVGEMRDAVNSKLS